MRLPGPSPPCRGPPPPICVQVSRRHWPAPRAGGRSGAAGQGGFSFQLDFFFFRGSHRFIHTYQFFGPAILSHDRHAPHTLPRNPGAKHGPSARERGSGHRAAGPCLMPVFPGGGGGSRRPFGFAGQKLKFNSAVCRDFFPHN